MNVRSTKVSESEKELKLLDQIQKLTKELSEERSKHNLSTKDALESAFNTKHNQRLLIVANRLPMSLSRNEKSGDYSFHMSSGGLVSALLGVNNIQMKWIGWPGTEVQADKQDDVRSRLRDQNCEPVFLTKQVVDNYYSGYSNGVIWPLFHYIPLPIGELQNSDVMFEAYESANQTFAEVVLKEYQPGDIVWVHDYHLMLLPAMLRAAAPTIKIGFFLHTPFPSSEIYRTFPQRETILRGLLSSDLIGFHIYDYARHFKSCCTRILGLDCTPVGVEIGNGFATVGTFPIGIDPKRFADALETKAVQTHIEELKKQFEGRKVIVGIDRLDYIKGIPHKLYALERFFQDNPHWVGKVALVQIAVPSRTDVKEYQRLARETHELVGRINGRFGSLSDVPVHYLDQSIPFEKMCALYWLADVCLITSLRDGMNLVSFEYIACQQHQEAAGVLILSEFAGAAQSLGAGSIRINPWDADMSAQAIQYALDMSPEERKEYQQYAIRYVAEHSSQHWGEKFVNELRCTHTTTQVAIVPKRLAPQEVCEHFATAQGHRVIVLGLVGTLTQKCAVGMSYDRFQRFAKCSDSNLKSLHTLGSDPNTTVVVLTSRSRVMCLSVLGKTPVWIAAENGLFVKKNDPSHKISVDEKNSNLASMTLSNEAINDDDNSVENEWKLQADNLDLSWMGEVSRVFDYFAERTPRSFVEKEDSFLSWHYRDADREFGELQARDLVVHLVTGPLVNTSAEVISSSKIVQVRPAGISKGNMADRILTDIQREKGPIGFMMCVGNFLGRDEDVFQRISNSVASKKRKRSVSDSHSTLSYTLSLPSSCYVATVNVGAKAGFAKNFVRNTNEVESLLRWLAGSVAHRDAVLMGQQRCANNSRDNVESIGEQMSTLNAGEDKLVRETSRENTMMTKAEN